MTIKDKLNVYKIPKNTRCAICRRDVKANGMIRVIKEKPRCLKCSGLDKLIFLPSGNRALTMRAEKSSPVYAVVMKWNNKRKRNERQGLLIEKAALKKAGDMCRADGAKRRAAREKAAVNALKNEDLYIDLFTGSVAVAYPGCGMDMAAKIAAHTCRKNSGRVGRSAAAKNFEPHTVKLAVKAYIRHNMTGYDALFEQGYNKVNARRETAAQVEKIMEGWKNPEYKVRS